VPYRYVITKASGQGEQITAEVAQCDPVTGKVMHSDVEMTKMLQHALSLTETRMAEMNVRMLEAYELSKYFSTDMWQRIKSILDILAGRQTAAMVANRWESEIEETRDLEAGRVAAYSNDYEAISPNGEGAS
jgi:hypothetical protein